MVNFSFSGHETFPFRYTWPTRAVRGVEADPALFTREHAPVTLGVGKNMVKSIRHWGEAMGLIERVEIKPLRHAPTSFGDRLCGMDGWDPFLEDPATSWLLHWKLVQSPDRATAWRLTFTEWGKPEFSRDELLAWILDWSKRSGGRATPASLRRDVGVLLRTYVPSRTTRDLPLEETFDSPLVGLGLLEQIDSRRYQFAIGPKPALPDPVFHCALLDIWKELAAGREALAAERVLHGPGSLGAAFKLSENDAVARLERLPRSLGIRYDETAGMRMLYGQPNISDTLSILERYYAAHGGCITIQ